MDVKLIVCTDQHSVDLYKLAISRIGEALIRKIYLNDLDRLNTDSWSIYKVEEAQAGKRWIFLTLNVECMEALRAASSCIGFGFTSIELRIFKKDSLASSKSSGATSVAEPLSALCEAEELKHLLRFWSLLKTSCLWRFHRCCSGTAMSQMMQM